MRERETELGRMYEAEPREIKGEFQAARRGSYERQSLKSQNRAAGCTLILT